MKRLWLSALLVGGGVASGGDAEFAPPVRIMGGDAAVRVESPGWAYPCLADLDGDGKKELLVGQFNGGKIKVYQQVSGEKFSTGKWLQAGGKDAEVPGVW